jgi:transposase InsO family protein
MSETVELKSYSIEKFAGKNFHIWKKVVKNLLIDEDVWKYVDPKTDISTLTAENIEKLDGKAGRLILKTIAWTEINNVLHLDSGREIWKSLHDIYEGDSLTHVVNLKREFYTTIYKEGEDLQEHLAKIRKAGDQIRSLGYSLSEEELCHVVLVSLPRSFDVVTGALGRSKRGELTWNVLASQLRQEILRREEEKPNADAHYRGTDMQKDKHLQNRYYKGDQRGDQFRRQCYFCQKFGHIAVNCFYNPNGKNFKGRKLDDNNKGGSKQEEADAKVIMECDDDEIIAAMMIEENNENEVVEVLAAVRNDGTDLDKRWILDSGASRHFSGERHLFKNLRKVNPVNVRLGDNKRVTATEGGELELLVKDGDKTKILKLKNVLFTPELKINLISLAELYNHNQTVQFSKKGVDVFDSNGIKLTHGVMKRNLYWIEVLDSDEHAKAVVAMDDDLWHTRFGHVHDAGLKRIVDGDMVRGISKFSHSSQCIICAEGKISRKPLTAVYEIRSKNILDLIHIDLCGPMQCNSLGGAKYFLSIIDDFSRYMFVFLLKNKSDAIEKLIEFSQQCITQNKQPPKIIKSDNGGEFNSTVFQNYCKKKGIIRQFTAAYTPEQNGIAERSNRTIVEMTRCILNQRKIPTVFWGEAVKTAVYLRNRCARKKSKKTAYELWHQRKPTVSHLKVFGCVAVAQNPLYRHNKLSNKGLKYIFVGYSTNSLTYRLYDPIRKKLVMSRDVEFFEYECFDFSGIQDMISLSNQAFIYVGGGDSKIEQSNTAVRIETETSTDASNHELENPLTFSDDNLTRGDDSLPTQDLPQDSISHEIQDTTVVLNPLTAVIAPPQTNLTADTSVATNIINQKRERVQTQIEKPVRKRFRPKGFEDFVMLVESENIHEPKTHEEAISSPEKIEWKKAIDQELLSHQYNGTWTLVNKPKGARVIENKWIFKKKMDKDGRLERYKARLVAKGYTQIEGIDYEEVYSPVSRPTTVRVLLTLAATLDYEVLQADVKTAFLHGELQEEIYMTQPPGTVKEGREELVCKLNKSLYGLKQASKCWNDTFDAHMKSVGFKQNKSDECLYTLQNEERWIAVVVYVDDILIVGKTVADAKWAKLKIEERFSLSETSEAKFYLGIQICRDRAQRKIFLSQKQYVDDLVVKFEQVDAKPAKSPMEDGVNFAKLSEVALGGPADEVEYRKIIGSLLYLSNWTRPDIANAITVLSQFLSCPRQIHMTSALRVVSYLNGTNNLSLTLGSKISDLSTLTNFVDADWGNSMHDRKSITGYLFKIGTSLVSWRAKRQKGNALSSTESEFNALVHSGKEAIWLRNLLGSILGLDKIQLNINEDNQGAIQMMKNSIFKDKSKHVENKFYWLRDFLNDSYISMFYCPTELMEADILTKPLGNLRFLNMRKLLF